MTVKSHLKLNLKFNLTLSLLLLILFLGTALLTYRDQQQMAQKVALEQGRSVSRELITIFNHMSDIVRNEPETNYALVPQVVSTQIARQISQGERYRIRQVSLNFRNPGNEPDAYEAEQLTAFTAGSNAETYQVTKTAGVESFRYMQSLVADDSCLKCHGSYASAPVFIQQRFPADHPSYNYNIGDVIGAVSVVRPMADLYGDIASGLQQELFYRAGILLIVLLVTWLFVRQLIITPLKAASTTIQQITATGNLHERIPFKDSGDEVGQLFSGFNRMMAELDRTTLQRQESEDRYRSLIEAAQSAVLTFLENGKIVISNKQAEQLIGLSRSELLGETFFDYLENGDKLRDKVIEFARAEKQGSFEDTSVYRLRSVSGETTDMNVTLVLASEVEDKPMFTAILRAM